MYSVYLGRLYHLRDLLKLNKADWQCKCTGELENSGSGGKVSTTTWSHCMTTRSEVITGLLRGFKLASQ